jgi:DNA repair protein RadC
MEANEPKVLILKEWAQEDRPREKLLLKGKASLSDAELLGIIIGTGIRKMTAVDLAMQILKHVNNDLSQLARLSVKDLSKFKGIGEAKAINIVSALELGRRRKNEIHSQPIIRTSKHIYEYISPIFADLGHEEFWVLLLNRQNKVLKAEKISSGGIHGTVVDSKMLYKIAIDNLASGVILCHNHPSGSLKPSDADIKVTEKIIKGAEILDLNVLDHIIFSDEGYFSFNDNGLLH